MDLHTTNCRSSMTHHQQAARTTDQWQLMFGWFDHQINRFVAVLSFIMHFIKLKINRSILKTFDIS
jgi:hypothetical protein